MKVIYGKEISFAKKIKISRLEKAYISSEYSVSAIKELFWQIKESRGLCAVIDDNKVVAFFSLVSLEKKYYDMLKEGKIKDSDFPIKAIAPYSKKHLNYFYLSSLVIASEVRSLSLFLCLEEAIFTLASKLASKNIYGIDVAIDAISLGGESFARYIGMKKYIKTNHNSTIYTAKLIPFEFKCRNEKSKEIAKLYELKEKEINGQ